LEHKFERSAISASPSTLQRNNAKAINQKLAPEDTFFFWAAKKRYGSLEENLSPNCQQFASLLRITN
jgi:hypothetical protein